MTKTPNILLIYTGGTIGMVKEANTNTLIPFNFDELLEHIPELKLLDCHISTISFEQPIDSSNMNLRYYKMLGDMIYQQYEQYSGFVVLHGSDTMSYTASIVSFMFENLQKPIIFTGSQLPIGDLRTDAKENLITAIQIAALQEEGKAVVTEVGLYFEYKLLRGNRTTKINAEHFEAFKSYNYPTLITSGVHLKINHSALFRSDPQNKLIYHQNFDNRIILIKLFPGLTTPVLNHMIAIPDLQGIILETYGAGNTTTTPWFLNSIKQLIAKGIPIINVTQCAAGSVNMGQYETSSELKKIGVIDGKDSTTETAITKLMYLLGEKTDPNTFKTIYETSLRGEIS